MIETATPFQRLLQQHRELEGPIERVRCFVSGETGPSDVSERFEAALAERLGELRAELAAHFRFEESSGAFDVMAEDFPEAASRLESLVSQHRSLLAEADRLVAACRSASEASEPARRRLAGSALALLAHVEAHERNETELIQRTYTQDLGSPD